MRDMQSFPDINPLLYFRLFPALGALWRKNQIPKYNHIMGFQTLDFFRCPPGKREARGG